MRRILLVEDHSSFRRALAFVLEREPDLRVAAQAGSVAEARIRIDESDGLDAAVLDLRLPDGEGVDLVEELREVSPETAILVLTVALNPKDHDRALRAGADAVLGKEAAVAQIVGTVQRTISERQRRNGSQ
jgi:DNA-binding NarL/FixJ family response regulator